jgi:serine/threonine-protein kinase RsbW
VMVFSRTRFFSDDLTCVAVKVGGGCDGDPLSRMEAEFGGRLEELEALRLFVRRASTASGLETTDEDTQWQIGIALNEAFTNIVKHAYEGNPEGRIRAVAEIFPDEWVFSLHHTGKPFERLDEPAPPLDLGRENGFGLIIMDNYMDGITYSRNPDGTNTVRLVKKRR